MKHSPPTKDDLRKANHARIIEQVAKDRLKPKPELHTPPEIKSLMEGLHKEGCKF